MNATTTRKLIATTLVTRRPIAIGATVGWLLVAATAVAQPQITTQPKSTTTSLCGNARFGVYATSTNPPITYQWWFRGAALDPVANPSAAQAALSLTNMTLANGGPYFAVAADTSGSATSQTATLTVDPTFTKISTGPGEPKPTVDYGCSLAWWDYDNDGFLDLFIADGFYDDSSTPSRSRLYHNNRDGTFTRITNVISTTLGAHLGGALGDYDNDGNEDLLVPTYNGAQELYHNDGGGSFTRLTKGQVGPVIGDADVSMAADWVDYDRDGFLDVFRANGYPSPANDCLYRNNADGTFTKMTTNEVGQIVNDHAATVESAWGDYDNDGWPDLWVPNLDGKNLLYHNDHGFFRKVTDPNNSIVQQGGIAGAGVWADYDNDGFLDLFVVGVVGKPHALHRNLGGSTFTNVTASAGIPTNHQGEDACWGDYDNDGFLDLYITADPPYPSLLLHNNGDGTFTSVDVGSPIHDNISYSRWGAAWGDYDNDGFLDLAVACVNAPNLLYHNNGNSNHWLKVKLTGTASNRSALGAKVRVQATIRGRQMCQMREIMGTSWCGGTPGLVAHFGLGDATNVDVVRIEWPSGLVQELHDVAPNQSLKIPEHQEGVTNAPSLTASRSAAGTIQLTLTGQTNLLYVFEASTNLARWTKIAVRTNLTGSVDFTARPATNSTHWFYRGVVP